MSPDTLRFVLQVVAIALGGGSVQMGIFLLKRRSELRSLDATSGSTALTSANEYIATLQGGEKAIREELDKAQARSQAMQKEWDIERAIEANASVLAFIGTGLGYFAHPTGWCCRRSLQHSSSSMPFRGGARRCPFCGA